jgi:hypothetical protein
MITVVRPHNALCRTADGIFEYYGLCCLILCDQAYPTVAPLSSRCLSPDKTNCLTIGTSTVKFHLGKILSKLGVETRGEAILVAAKNDII